MIASRHFFLYIIAAFVCTHAHARQVQPEWGDLNIRTRNTPTLERIVKGQPDELIAVGIKWTPNALHLPQTFVATRFDTDLKKVMEQELFATGNRVDFHNVYNFKGNVFLFTRQFKRKEKVTSLNSTQIDPVTLKVIETNEIGQFDAITRGRQPEINIKTSPDTSRILVFTEAPYDGTESLRFYVNVLDHNMHKQWDKVITLPYLNKFISIEGFDISNDGEVVIICKHYDRNVLRERVRENGVMVPSYTYKILMVGKNDDRPKEHAVHLQNRFVHAMTSQFDIDGNIHLLGLYKDKRNGNVSGHFRTVLDKNSPQTDVQKMEPFPVDDLLKLLYKDFCGTINPNDPGLSDRFKVIGTNLRSDESIDLLTEVNYSYEKRDDDDHTTTIYVADDILVINYKKDGSVLYTRIPKSQSEHSDTYISFKWMKYGSALLLFYNDSEKNVNRELSKRPDDMSIVRSVFVMAIVDDQGGLQRKVAYSHKDIKMYTDVNASAVIDTNVLALYAERNQTFSKSRYQFGRLKL
jgi:hypothetical protein